MGNKVTVGADKVAYHVYVTANYDKFRFIDGNRDINSLSNLRKSIKSHGWYRQPILVNERFEIIEGQHRYSVCKEIGLPIEYIVQPGLAASDCAPLNTGRTNWRTRNYAHLHAVGNIDYMYFEELLNQFQFSPRVTLVAIGTSLTGGGINKTVKGGTLKCSPEQYEKGSRTLRWLSQFNEDIKQSGIRGSRDNLYMALIFARNSKSVSTDNLTDRVHRNFARFGKAIADMTDAVEKVNEIYNYKVKTENIIDLVAEYRIASRKEKINESKVKG